MGFWTAVVLIVAIGTISEMYSIRFKKSSRQSEALFKELSGRLAGMEERMANIETIVLEKEKVREFAELESG
jgi:hypothetical protein